MAEDLQYLIDRIRKEAVEKADAEAASIIAKAKEQASQIVKTAESDATAKLAKADKDAVAYTERSERTLDQSARDLIIAVGKRLEKLCTDILALNIQKDLNDSTVKEMLLKLASSLGDADISFSENDSKALASFVTGELSKKAGSTLSIDCAPDINFGFRIKQDAGRVSLEFTDKAIAEALSAHLRPELAKVVTEAAQGK